MENRNIRIWYLVGMGFIVLCLVSIILYFDVADGNRIMNPIEGTLILIILISAFLGVMGIWVAGEYSNKECKEDMMIQKIKETKSKEKNPAYFCMGCNKYLGFRGFCSIKCHNKHYDGMGESS